jgi:hypothetical protein
MDSQLDNLLARARAEELRRVAGARGRRNRRPGEAPAIPASTPVTLRFAFPDDLEAVARLAALDSAEPPALPVLLGEVGGEPRAAISLSDGAVVADPFHPTAALVDLLRARADQLQGVVPARRLRRFRLGGLAWRSAWR